MSTPSLFNERKAAEAAAFLLYKARGSLPLIKLIKLLYLSERLSLERYGEPLTGDRLVSMTHGPVLSRTYDHINGALQSTPGGWDTWVSDRSDHVVELRDSSMLRSPEQDLMALSDSDLEVLGETWNQFGHWDRWALVDYTHRNLPEWKDPEGSSCPITYADLFAKLGYEPEKVKLLVDRLAEQARLNANFS